MNRRSSTETPISVQLSPRTLTEVEMAERSENAAGDMMSNIMDAIAEIDIYKFDPWQLPST